jgi:hypothetical protein
MLRRVALVRCNIQEDGILHSHRHENLKSNTQHYLSVQQRRWHSICQHAEYETSRHKGTHILVAILIHLGLSGTFLFQGTCLCHTGWIPLLQDLNFYMGKRGRWNSVQHTAHSDEVSNCVLATKVQNPCTDIHKPVNWTIQDFLKKNFCSRTRAEFLTNDSQTVTLLS